MENNSDILLVLHGLNGTLSSGQIYFSFVLVSYIFTIFVNLTLIVTIRVEKTLHQPLYVFLVSLCFNGIFGASTFYPKLLHDLLTGTHVISYTGCLTQVVTVYYYVFFEFTTLTIMAYDRYLAICKPLQYNSLMTMQRVLQLLLLTWSFTLLETVVGTILTARLPLCGNQIRKLYCTNWEVVKLSCSDTTLNNIYGFTLIFSHVLQMLLIMVSYVHLVRASLRSCSDRRKFVQTCLPHLVTLLIFTTSLVFDSLFSRYGGGQLQVLQNVMAVEFLVVPPLINPIIYGIKLQQIRSKILGKITHKTEVARQQ